MKYSWKLIFILKVSLYHFPHPGISYVKEDLPNMVAVITKVTNESQKREDGKHLKYSISEEYK